MLTIRAEDLGGTTAFADVNHFDIPPDELRDFIQRARDIVSTSALNPTSVGLLLGGDFKILSQGMASSFVQDPEKKLGLPGADAIERFSTSADPGPWKTLL